MALWDDIADGLSGLINAASAAAGAAIPALITDALRGNQHAGQGTTKSATVNTVQPVPTWVVFAGAGAVAVTVVLLLLRR